MSNKSKNIINENTVQAILVADTFGDEFIPISNDIPFSLLPLVNKPLIDYTLEFLSLGGIEETFLFCCTHIEEIKAHISESIKNSEGWTLTMKVNIIASESCRSFGDCLRDLDAKGLLRGDFVLLEPGTISNIDLLPLIKKHHALTKVDKGCAMTLIFQEAGIGYFGRSPQEEILLAVNNHNRVLFHKKLGKNRERRIDFPLEIFLENSEVSLLHNLKDTHIAICSPSVLPLFSDNFDFQTKDDFVRGLLIMNEDFMGTTVYHHLLKGSQFGGSVTNWRMYQALSRELTNRWIYPLLPCTKRNKILKNEVAIGNGVKLGKNVSMCRTVLGKNVKIGNNVKIEDSFIFPDTKIEDNVIITHSVIGPKATIKSKSRITVGSILGKGVIIEPGSFVENTLVQSTEPEDCEENDKLGKHAFRLLLDDDEEEDVVDAALARKMSRLHIDKENPEESDDCYAFSDSDGEDVYYTNSPVPDDTKLFFTEVIDSLTRGFEDQLLCDNLILEINSSRYAYNVTVKEVNFNVIKAILTMSFRQPSGPQYFSHFSRLLSYFAPILKNYIRNDGAMADCLQAIEDVAVAFLDKLNEKWTVFVLQYLYDKDHISEDSILQWANNLEEGSKFHSIVKPFVEWLQEAEEGSSSEEESE